MRFTSLIVELIRARPGLIVGIAIAAQALLWVVTPLIAFGSPPGNIATVLAFGREYQVATDLGPPLAFWLADVAYRAAGQHIFGVYILAQACGIVTFVALYRLGRSLVGGPHAAIAVLLTMTVTAFSVSGATFGPGVLARPLWALTLLQTWRIVGEGRREAWFGLSLVVGLLILSTPDAVWLLAVPLGFMLVTSRGRSHLASRDFVFALLVIGALALPWLASRARGTQLADWLPAIDRAAVDGSVLQAALFQSMLILGTLVVMILPPIILWMLNRWIVLRRDQPPVIHRNEIETSARDFAMTIAVAPILLAVVLVGQIGWPRAIANDGVVLLGSGLGIVVLAGDTIALRRQTFLRKAWIVLIAAPALAVLASAFVVPWIAADDRAPDWPASTVAQFFGESFERRTGRALPAVTGDPSIAALVAMGASRPHLLLDATPERTPWLTRARFEDAGGVVVWRAFDTVGSPPPALARHFPGLTPEVPRAFESLRNGRQPPPRIGWAIVRPKS